MTQSVRDGIPTRSVWNQILKKEKKMESTLLHPSHRLPEFFDLKGEVLRLKILAEALTACVSDDKEFRYQYLHQLMILPKKQQSMLVNFSGIPHDEYKKEFEGFTDAMKFLVISIKHIEAHLEKQESIKE